MHLAALGRMEKGAPVSSACPLGPGRAWLSMAEHMRLLQAAVFGADTGALRTHCLQHAEKNSSQLPSVLSAGSLSLSHNPLHRPKAGGCPGCEPRVEGCQSPAGQGRAIPPSGVAFKALALFSEIFFALLRCVADLFLLIFKYQVYLVYLLLLINVRIKNQREYSSNELFLKSDKLIPLDMAEAREDLFVPLTNCSH